MVRLVTALLPIADAQRSPAELALPALPALDASAQKEWHCLPSALQAGLQSKRLELRASVLDSLRSTLLQQPRAGEETEVLVHTGFLEAYASVRSEVLRLLETVFSGAKCCTPAAGAGCWCCLLVLVVAMSNSRGG